MKKTDHIVYAVPHLQTAMDQIENQFGIRPNYGGKHQDQGTHNALINLGNECYFELIAIDPENKQIQGPRWMGVDLIDQAKITRWAVKSDSLQEDADILKSINPQLANTKTGMRQKEDGSILNWQLSMPLPHPQVEAIPFLLDWQDSQHPTSTIPQSCELISFTIRHPEVAYLTSVLDSLKVKVKIEASNEIALIAEIDTPKGRIILS